MAFILNFFVCIVISLTLAAKQANPNQLCPDDITTSVCISSCSGVPNGDYKSCVGTSVYVTCSNGYMYDNRPCPSTLIWNDSIKRCDYRRNLNEKLFGRFSVNLANNDYGKTRLNTGNQSYKRWKLMEYSRFSFTSSSPTSVTCATRLIYQFTPPKCLKKITFKFKAEVSKNLIFAILNVDALENFSTSDTSNIYTTATSGDKIALYKGQSDLKLVDDHPGNSICGEISSNYVSYKGVNSNGSYNTTSDKKKVFENMSSKKFTFVLNVDWHKRNDFTSRTCEMDILWEC